MKVLISCTRWVGLTEGIMRHNDYADSSAASMHFVIKGLCLHGAHLLLNKSNKECVTAFLGKRMVLLIDSYSSRNRVRKIGLSFMALMQWEKNVFLQQIGHSIYWHSWHCTYFSVSGPGYWACLRIVRQDWAVVILTWKWWYTFCAVSHTVVMLVLVFLMQFEF